MALFLSESISHISNKEISDIDMMTSLMEAQQEMAMFTESVLRADFILHEQCRTLLENEGEGAQAEVDSKEKGFLSKMWDVLVKIVKIVKKAIINAYNWIKTKVQKFWNWVRKAYAHTKFWVITAGRVFRLRVIRKYLEAVSYLEPKALALLGAEPNATSNAINKEKLLDLATKFQSTSAILDEVYPEDKEGKSRTMTTEEIESFTSYTEKYIDDCKKSIETLEKDIDEEKTKLSSNEVEADAKGLISAKIKLYEIRMTHLTNCTKYATEAINLVTTLKAVRESNDKIDADDKARKEKMDSED
jgi:hypothetical protein